jgi:ribonucleoside-triphosphate reductase (thioredoxin)
MSLKSLQDYTYYSKYARYNKAACRRETWGEAVDRVKNMHLQRFPQIENEIEWAFEQVRQKRVLGSQRALQFGGEPILRKHARLYNCTVSFCDRVRFFQEAFWLLLCGCGVGFSVQKHHIAKLPQFSFMVGPNLTNDKVQWGAEKTFVIPDTIEGWADALGVLIESYFESPEIIKGTEWEGTKVKFDYGLIRKKGSLLSSGSGKAPGPEPLRRSLEVIRQLLDRCILNGQQRLRPIDAYDIVMHASDAVLSGGVRRSATICLFSLDDVEMTTAKTGNWFTENPQRGRSNNSALLLRDKTTREEFLKLIESVKEFGEPGFVWSDSTELVVNPCVEIGMCPMTDEGESGWQMCNLCEINGKKIKSEEDWYRAAKAAAIIGTCQAAYTDFEYLGPITKRIVEKEALLGVSITGMMDSPEILFNPILQRKMAKVVLTINEDIAPKIGINPCARATCIKPAGTTSCLLGTGSGVHAHHAHRYFRRTQANAMEAPLQFFKKFNPAAIEKSVWSANGTDEVITFCIEVPPASRVKNDMDAITLLEHVKLTQANWVTAGCVQERCRQPWLMHNVSNTINVEPHEWGQVAEYIYKHRRYFAGISLLPISGDKDYPQAPMCQVFTPKEIVAMYGDGSLMASGLIVDGLKVFDNNLWEACDAALGFGKPLVEPMIPNELNFSQHVEYQADVRKYHEKADWIRRAKQFAFRYFENDLRQMTYCLKDVNNWKQWLDLTREYKDVDYTEMYEEEDNTRPMDTIACAGGKCQVL